MKYCPRITPYGSKRSCGCTMTRRDAMRMRWTMLDEQHGDVRFLELALDPGAHAGS